MNITFKTPMLLASMLALATPAFAVQESADGQNWWGVAGSADLASEQHKRLKKARPAPKSIRACEKGNDDASDCRPSGRNSDQRQ